MSEEIDDGNGTRFVFVVPTYNCQDSIGQTILSVIAQSYDNWRMIIRDDMSTDGTFDVADRFVSLLNCGNQIKVTANSEKHGEVRNTLEALKEIEDDEVICRLDGGDWLTDLDGLAMLDAMYQYYGDELAIAWTKHRWSFTNKNISGPLKSEDEDVYADVDDWRVSHLKTWRRSAIDGINDANFRDENGEYIMNACDRAIMLPMLHKAKLEGKRRIYMPVVMYHYTINDVPETYQTERAKNQRAMAEFIHRRGYIE